MARDVSQIDEQKEMSFLDHLEELRWHLVRSIAAIFICAVVLFSFKTFVFEQVVFAPKHADFWTYQFICGISDLICFSPPDLKLITRDLGEQFFVHLKVSIWLGFILSSPIVFYEIWRFVKPGLYKEEKNAARGLVLACTLLFLLGVVFGYFIIAPFAITFLGSYQVGVDAINSPTLSSFVHYMTMFTLPTGFVFELPILVYFLSRIGLVTPEFMKKYRKHAVIVILVLSAAITPPDVMTQFLIGIPIFILYEISILIAKRTRSKYFPNET